MQRDLKETDHLPTFSTVRNLSISLITYIVNRRVCMRGCVRVCICVYVYTRCTLNNYVARI